MTAKSTLSDYVKKYLKENYIPYSSASSAIGISTSTFKSWLIRNSFPAKELPQLAHFCKLFEDLDSLKNKFDFEIARPRKRKIIPDEEPFSANNNEQADIEEFTQAYKLAKKHLAESGDMIWFGMTAWCSQKASAQSRQDLVREISPAAIYMGWNFQIRQIYDRLTNKVVQQALYEEALSHLRKRRSQSSCKSLELYIFIEENGWDVDPIEALSEELPKGIESLISSLTSKLKEESINEPTFTFRVYIGLQPKETEQPYDWWIYTSEDSKSGIVFIRSLEGSDVRFSNVSLSDTEKDNSITPEPNSEKDLYAWSNIVLGCHKGKEANSYIKNRNFEPISTTEPDIPLFKPKENKNDGFCNKVIEIKEKLAPYIEKNNIDKQLSSEHWLRIYEKTLPTDDI